jgi:hypothetical protein
MPTVVNSIKLLKLMATQHLMKKYLSILLWICRWITISIKHWKRRTPMWHSSFYHRVMRRHTLLYIPSSCGSVVGWATKLQAKRYGFNLRWGHRIFQLT